MPSAYKTIAVTVSLSGDKGTTPFDDKVTEAMKDGWTPHGSMSVIGSSTGFIRMMQPMVRHNAGIGQL